jgi:hypothetical protein
MQSMHTQFCSSFVVFAVAVPPECIAVVSDDMDMELHAGILALSMPMIDDEDQDTACLSW